MTTLDLPEEPDPPRRYRVEIPRVGKKWLTSNTGRHPRFNASTIRQWREVAAWRARGLPTIQKAHIVCELRFGVKRRRDPANWYPTCKAIVDGLVDGGVFPDDDHRHVIGPDMRIGPFVTRAEESVVVHIYRIEEGPS